MQHLTTYIKYFESSIKLLPLSNKAPVSSQHERALKTLRLILESKVERLIRKYRDHKLQAIQAQSIKDAATRKLHKHVTMRTTDKARRSHREEDKKEYRDAVNPRMEEY